VLLTLYERNLCVLFLLFAFSRQYAWIWLLWLLSQTWVTLHIWTPKCERLAATEKLFVTPMYCSLLIDQSLAMNRRMDEEGEVKTEVNSFLQPLESI
jgi:chitin synthase